MKGKYLVVDEEDAYHTYVTIYDNQDEMLCQIQHKKVEHLSVYEISRKIELKKQIAMVVDESITGKTT